MTRATVISDSVMTIFRNRFLNLAVVPLLSDFLVYNEFDLRFLFVCLTSSGDACTTSLPCCLLLGSITFAADSLAWDVMPLSNKVKKIEVLHKY